MPDEVIAAAIAASVEIVREVIMTGTVGGASNRPATAH